MESNDEDAVVRDRIASFSRHFTTRRQIHSNLANRLESYGRGLIIVTIAVSAAVAFVAFSGTDRLITLFAGWHRFAPNTVQLTYDLVVLAILLVTILGLVYRFDERAGRHRNAIEKLTSFIRDAEDAVALSEAGVRKLAIADLDRFRERYKGITDGLPPTTDRQFAKAKKDLARKSNHRKHQARLRWAPEGAGVEPAFAQRLANLMGTPTRRPILEAVREALGPDAWVTGGAVRDAVWDELHDYRVATPLDDVDVVWFGAAVSTKELDRDLEGRLERLSGNIDWSVKNEARMHVTAGDAPYASLREALARAPETATAIAVRLDGDDTLRVLAPHGLSDMFAGLVHPTPGFDINRYEARAIAKQWAKRWPQLQVWHPS